MPYRHNGGVKGDAGNIEAIYVMELIAFPRDLYPRHCIGSIGLKVETLLLRKLVDSCFTLRTECVVEYATGFGEYILLPAIIPLALQCSESLRRHPSTTDHHGEFEVCIRPSPV
jgi:hypothetical protein